MRTPSYRLSGVRLDPVSVDRLLAAILTAGALLDAWRGGENQASKIEETMRKQLLVQPEIGIEYIAVAEPEALAPVSVVDADTVVALAARVGGTRLIDNIVLGQGLA